MEQRLRSLPSVDTVLRYLARAGQIPHPMGVAAARAALAEARAEIRAGAVVDKEVIFSRAVVLVAEQRRRRLRPVINATGVIISTNLGRAPLSKVAVTAMETIAGGYSNLEYDMEAGTRGSRQNAIRDLLCQVTGAEDGLVVNNNAAALLLVLATLAAQQEVVVSRGQLVEIGGGFRIPDLMRQSGARLVEVGTTNRTRLSDFEEALSDDTSLLLIVHPSNFRVIGFTESPNLAEVAGLAHARGLLLVHDVGSGCLLDTERWGLAHEPTPQESIEAGVDIVCFSGDKLLGGPQAGIIVGREMLLRRIAQYPLMRAVRSDKLTLAALEATLGLYRDGLAESELPIWRAIGLPIADLQERAERWAEIVCSWGYAASTIADFSTIGGGSLPGETLPTVVCAVSLDGGIADGLARDLRQGSPAVVARIARGRLLLDPRTVDPGQDELLLQALSQTMRTNPASSRVAL
ncbi:MAG: L-seryl-tRNA(Sec) selenium transferase [Ktedonobacterales bacterium]